MALETAALLTAIGTATAVAGTATQMYGQRQQTKATKKAEGLRKQQMEMESTLKRRQIMRQSQLARATGLSNATAQGADTGDSAVQGAIAANSTALGEQLFANQESLEIGQGIFSANAQNAEAQSTSAIGNSVNTFGTGLIKNSTQIAQIGTELFGEKTGNGDYPFQSSNPGA